MSGLVLSDIKVCCTQKPKKKKKDPKSVFIFAPKRYKRGQCYSLWRKDPILNGAKVFKNSHIPTGLSRLSDIKVSCPQKPKKNMPESRFLFSSKSVEKVVNAIAYEERLLVCRKCSMYSCISFVEPPALYKKNRLDGKSITFLFYDVDLNHIIIEGIKALWQRNNLKNCFSN